MRVGSLFSGIGGLELALEAFGHEVVWQAECDPYALAVLAKHWPNVHRYTDVREIDERATRVDILCGGFPCQPHSLAGKRRGTSDARWLWPEFARIAEVLRPSALFIENVPGLRTSGLRNVLADLARLGFDAEWDCFWAAETGAPHRRRRLFVLAYADGDAWRLQPRRGGGEAWADPADAEHDGAHWDVAHCSSNGRHEGQRNGNTEDSEARSRGDGFTLGGNAGAHPWSVEPSVGRVVHELPSRVDRLKCLGNAVVPQQAALAWQTLTARARTTSERAA